MSTAHKTWLEGSPTKWETGRGLKGTKTTKWKKSKCYPSNYVYNEITGKYELPKK